MGGSREYEQAEKAAGARTNALTPRHNATNSEAPGPDGAEACVKHIGEVFDQPVKMAPHRTPNANAFSRGVRESRG